MFVLFEFQRAKQEYVEIVAENSPKPAGNMILQIQEVEQTSTGQTLKNSHQGTSSSNFRKLNTKEKTLKATRGKQHVAYKGKTIQMSMKLLETKGSALNGKKMLKKGVL